MSRNKKKFVAFYAASIRSSPKSQNVSTKDSGNPSNYYRQARALTKVSKKEWTKVSKASTSYCPPR